MSSAGCHERHSARRGELIAWRGWDDHRIHSVTRGTRRVLVAEWRCCSPANDTRPPLYRPEDSYLGFQAALGHDDAAPNPVKAGDGCAAHSYCSVCYDDAGELSPYCEAVTRFYVGGGECAMPASRSLVWWAASRRSPTHSQCPASTSVERAGPSVIEQTRNPRKHALRHALTNTHATTKAPTQRHPQRRQKSMDVLAGQAIKEMEREGKEIEIGARE